MIGVDEAATQPLFYKYQVITVPRVHLLNKALTRYEVDVHLVMDVVVQAILATEGETDWGSAWESALGYNPESN